MLDPFFLQSLSEFRAKYKDERTPRIHKSSVPAIFNEYKYGQGLTGYSLQVLDNASEPREAQYALGFYTDCRMDAFTSSYQRGFPNNTQNTKIVSFHMENEQTGTNAGEGFMGNRSYYATSANNDDYNYTNVLTFAIKNPTNADVVVPANCLRFTGTSHEAQRTMRVYLSVPDAALGSVTSIAHTQLAEFTGNTQYNQYNMASVTIPAGRTILIHFSASDYMITHSTTYDVQITGYYMAVQGWRRFLNASTSPTTYVEGSYDTILKPDYQMTLNLLGRKHLTMVDAFNETEAFWGNE